MIKVTHIIASLTPSDGAEMMLGRVTCGMDGRLFENEIVSLSGLGKLVEKMRAMGMRVRTLGMKESLPNPLLVFRLAQWIRESKPDVIHTWMYHANLVGALAARLAGHVPVVWGIHHSALDPSVEKRRTLWVNRACVSLSGTIPARILFCSHVSQQVHEEYGYAREKMEVIPNGFDLDQEKPDPAASAWVRRELGVPPDAPLIGIAARFHPQKDHRNFVRAAGLLHARIPNCHFVLCGSGITWQNTQLAGWIEAAGIRNCCHLLGYRQDVSRIFGGIDIATMSSVSGEAFPLVIGEAMACGVPCVVTDVGDSALIVGQTGRVVATSDPAALAEAWRELIDAGPEVRHRLGTAARRWVEQHYSLQAVVERYQSVYARLAGKS